MEYTTWTPLEIKIDKDFINLFVIVNCLNVLTTGILKDILFNISLNLSLFFFKYTNAPTINTLTAIIKIKSSLIKWDKNINTLVNIGVCIVLSVYISSKFGIKKIRIAVKETIVLTSNIAG